MGAALAVETVCPRLTLNAPFRVLPPTGATLDIADLCRAELRCRNQGAVREILAAIPDHATRKRLLEAADHTLADVCEAARLWIRAFVPRPELRA
jgi:hypothetical protein